MRYTAMFNDGVVWGSVEATSYTDAYHKLRAIKKTGNCDDFDYIMKENTMPEQPKFDKKPTNTERIETLERRVSDVVASCADAHDELFRLGEHITALIEYNTAMQEKIAVQQQFLEAVGKRLDNAPVHTYTLYIPNFLRRFFTKG